MYLLESQVTYIFAAEQAQIYCSLFIFILIKNIGLEQQLSLYHFSSLQLELATSCFGLCVVREALTFAAMYRPFRMLLTLRVLDIN